MSIVICVSGRLLWFGAGDLLMALVFRLIAKSPIDLLKIVFLWVTLLADFEIWVMFWFRCRKLLWNCDLWLNWHWFDVYFEFSCFFWFFGWILYDDIDLWYFAHFQCFVSMVFWIHVGLWAWIFTAYFAIGFYGHLRWCSGMSFVMISTSSCGGMCMGILANENRHWFLWSFVM